LTDDTPAPGGLGAGSRVAGYRLDEVAGRGGMAVVYRAFDTRLERRVALKVLSPELAQDQAFRQRFIRESRAAAAVDHPNIIPIFEAGEAGGVLFIAMRFVSGRDVQSLVESGGPLPAGRACHIISQVAAALDAAHANGLVHRDVKPANMLLDASGGPGDPDHVYLSDFGLSKHSLSVSGLTGTGQFLGTLDYVAPEQIEARAVDARTDQYALACSAFTMLTGAPPFSREEPVAVMWAQMSAEPPALTSHRPDLPARADPVLARALAKAPGQRYGTCREFATALRRACGLDPGTSGPGPAGPQPPRGQTRAVPPADLAAAGAAAAAGPPAEPGSGPGGQPDAEAGPAGGPPTRAGPASTPGAAGSGPPAAGTGPPGRHPAVPPPSPAPGQDGARPRWLSWAVIGLALAAVLAAGGYFLLARGGGSAPPAAAALKPPGCTIRVAKAGQLPQVPSRLAAIGGHPFDVAATRGFAFVSAGNAVAVMSTAKPVPALLWTSPVASAQGEALTHDGRYLVVSGGSGLSVFRVSDLEHGAASPVGSLSSPGQQHAVEVAITPDDRFAFVTFQNSAHVGVFSLQRALRSGFGPSDLTGLIPVGPGPIGVAIAPGGQHAYVTSGLASAPGSGTGVVNVIDVRKAETRPAAAVVTTAGAGCQPSRVVAAADGQHLWVTAGGSNALLAFSAPKLLSDPRHALLARLTVGQLPLGLVIVRHGSRIVVADSNRDSQPGAVPNLAVIDTAKALAGKPAVLGYLRSGLTPRQFALVPGGGTLLVTDSASAQLQAVSLAPLP
jgi:serine/threonine-protein kinase